MSATAIRQFGEGAGSEPDNRRSACKSFGHHETERLVPARRDQAGSCGADHRRQLVMWEVTEVTDRPVEVRCYFGLEVGAVADRSCYVEVALRELSRRDGEVGTFFRGNFGRTTPMRRRPALSAIWLCRCRCGQPVRLRSGDAMRLRRGR